jgi:hypothetical protein
LIKQEDVQTLIPGFYNVKIPPVTQDSVLVFDAAYGSGFWSSMGKHVLVNSWQNGWKITSAESGKNTFIVFWPELLETIGLSGLLLWGSTFVVRKIKRT